METLNGPVPKEIHRTFRVQRTRVDASDGLGGYPAHFTAREGTPRVSPYSEVRPAEQPRSGNSLKWGCKEPMDVQVGISTRSHDLVELPGSLPSGPFQLGKGLLARLGMQAPSLRGREHEPLGHGHRRVPVATAPHSEPTPTVMLAVTASVVPVDQEIAARTRILDHSFPSRPPRLVQRSTKNPIEMKQIHASDAVQPDSMRGLVDRTGNKAGSSKREDPCRER